jgi:hypothetical protein
VGSDSPDSSGGWDGANILCCEYTNSQGLMMVVCEDTNQSVIVFHLPVGGDTSRETAVVGVSTNHLQFASAVKS